jgi:hypothetical protein
VIGGLVTSWSLACETNYQIASIDVEGTPAPLWDHLGLDFNAARTELFVVSPDTNELVRFDTSDTEVSGRVTVGSFPFDVDVMKVSVLGEVVERAYVVNHGNGDPQGPTNDDTLSIVNPANFTSQPISIALNADLAPPAFPPHLHVQRVAGNEQLVGGAVRAQTLFLVSGAIGRVIGYRLTPNGDSPQFGFEFATGPYPGNLALQKAAASP